MHDEPGRAHAGQQAGGGDAAETIQQEPLATVRITDNHRTDAFACTKSERVGSFFKNDFSVLVPQNYCRVFVLPNPDDATEIWGFYTLSPTALIRNRATGSDQKRIPGGIPIPLILIGYMGRHDAAPAGLGEALVVDAARRVFRNADIPAWGLALDSEGGPDNAKLWKWYQDQGFIPAKPDDRGKSGLMYAALKRFPL
jgi:hypothetical protein